MTLCLCISLSVQAQVIPAILESVSGGVLVTRSGYQPSDICVSAPTGSGKTLAFVIPVVQVSFGLCPVPKLATSIRCCDMWVDLGVEGRIGEALQTCACYVLFKELLVLANSTV